MKPSTKRVSGIERVIANAKKELARLNAKHDALVAKASAVEREMDKLVAFVKANES